MCFAGALLAVSCAFWVLNNLQLAHDQAWLLFAAQRVLSGAELDGPRIVEANPPLIIWFSMLPVVLARLLHSAPLTTLRLLTLLLTFASVAWGIRIVLVRKYRAETAALIGCALLFVECPQWNAFFGQREHLLILFTLPFIVAVASGAVSRLSSLERCALGICAALGICFKPQQALMLVGLYTFLLLSQRSVAALRTIEFGGVVLAGLAYVVCVRVFCPLYFQLIPLLRDTYWAYGTYTAWALVLKQAPSMAVGVLTLLGALILRRRSKSQPIILACLACALPASIVFDMQHTGFGYQQYPVLALIAFAAILLLIDLLEPVMDRLPSLEGGAWQHGAIVVGALILMAIVWVKWIEHRSIVAAAAPAYGGDVFDNLKSGESVTVFSTTLPVFTAVYERHLEWGSRFGQLGLLPATVKNESGAVADPSGLFKRLSPERTRMLADLQRTDATEDLNYWKPKRVLIEHCPCPYLDDPQFDMLAWFSRGPAFAAAWAYYRQQPSVRGFDVYDRVP